jgi:hypothetical protein
VDEDFVADVMSTLRLIPRWRLTPDEWDPVRASLERLAGAMDRGDAPAAATALEEIEGRGPSRLASVSRSSATNESSAGPTSPPEPVLEILNTLVHPAGGWTGPA